MSLNAALSADLKSVLVTLEAMKLKIKENVQSEDNPNGVLTKTEDEYLTCLALQDNLEVKLRDDDAFWSE